MSASPDPDTATSSSSPQLLDRPAQPYAAVRRRVTTDGFKDAVDSGYPELFGWLGARGIAPAGAPIIRYLAMNAGDGDDEFEIDLGVPVAAPVDAADGVRAEELPPGTWAVVVHEGSFDGLMAATEQLGRWIDTEGREPAQAPDASPGEERPLGHVETYLVDPSDEPDVSKWRTEIALLVAPS